MQGLIIFQYTNAYDVYSAEEIGELMDSDLIEKAEMNEDGCWLYCKNMHPVVKVLERFGFVYEIVENKLY